MGRHKILNFSSVQLRSAPEIKHVLDIFTKQSENVDKKQVALYTCSSRHVNNTRFLPTYTNGVKEISSSHICQVTALPSLRFLSLPEGFLFYFSSLLFYHCLLICTKHILSVMLYPLGQKDSFRTTVLCHKYFRLSVCTMAFAPSFFSVYAYHKPAFIIPWATHLTVFP